MSRQDLSNYVIHFIHGRNPENELLEYSYVAEDDEYTIPDSFTLEGKPIRLTNKYEEDDYGFPENADALDVLKKILHDGIIKTGWSFRGNKPTIYGPKSAACFTEMPLYALIQYSQLRNSIKDIEPYGIAFLKNEIFAAGARPVIYGLSGKHIEAKKADGNFGKGLRTLSEECGLGLKEMYRYVYTSFSKEKNISWMHEREWRWADTNEKFDYAGMPFFTANDHINFSRIIIIVKTAEERDEILKHLTHLIHSKSTNFEREYDLKAIARAYVLAIEDLDSINGDISAVKLDDLPLHSIPRPPKIIVSNTIYDKVKETIEAAGKICYDTSKKKYEERGDRDIAGICSIVTYVRNSEVTQALIDLDIAHSFGKDEYVIYLKSYPVQSLGVIEAGYNAAADFLTTELGQSFSVNSRWD